MILWQSIDVQAQQRILSPVFWNHLKSPILTIPVAVHLGLNLIVWAVVNSAHEMSWLMHAGHSLIQR